MPLVSARADSTDEEAARVAALHDLAILDTPPEAAYDNVVRIAAACLRADIASLTFVDETRVWSKANCGGKLKEFPRHGSHVDQVITEERPVVVLDLAREPGWPGLASVYAALGLRFFAGFPLRIKGGQVVGALCVCGREARRNFSPEELGLLERIASMAADQLELRVLRSAQDQDNATAHPDVDAAGLPGRWPNAKDLRAGLKQNQFVLHYQPEVELSTRRVVGMEALVRWQHPERGLVSPAHFIPQAEENGLILPLGDWGLGQACRQLQAWRQRWPDLALLRMCVNLSARQFSRAGLAQHVEMLLLQTGLSGRNLGLEMTESSLIPNMSEASEVLAGLHQLGISLHMDDFGTGYSSLSHLHTFPFDVLKIDRSFVQRMHIGEQPLQIVQTILELARVLGMEVVAEGIETEEQWQQLARMGCRYGQGYYFSPPLPAVEMEKLLEREQQRWANDALDSVA